GRSLIARLDVVYRQNANIASERIETGQGTVWRLSPFRRGPVITLVEPVGELFGHPSLVQRGQCETAAALGFQNPKRAGVDPARALAQLVLCKEGGDSGRQRIGVGVTMKVNQSAHREDQPQPFCKSSQKMRASRCLPGSGVSVRPATPSIQLP